MLQRIRSKHIFTAVVQWKLKLPLFPRQRKTVRAYPGNCRDNRIESREWTRCVASCINLQNDEAKGASYVCPVTYLVSVRSDKTSFPDVFCDWAVYYYPALVLNPSWPNRINSRALKTKIRRTALGLCVREDPIRKKEKKILRKKNEFTDSPMSHI